MPRSFAASVENNFHKGLITEATGLNFPENACTETYNCIFDRIGRVRRRPGFDFEQNYTTKTISRTACAISTFLWKNVMGDAGTTLFVAQIGSTLYFWDVTADAALSGGALATTIALTSFDPAGAPTLSDNECQFTSGNGYCFVVHPYVEPIMLSYSGGTVSATQINVYIRDFDGENDGYTIDNRPGSLTAAHNYNLLNQGWLAAHITTWDTARADWPSNADVWWYWKDSSDVFQTSLIDTTWVGNSAAPKGHYILNAWSQDRSTASGIGGLTTTSASYNRPTTAAFFGGRIFYAGVAANGYATNVYFSRINRHQLSDAHIASEFGICHQANDPTAEVNSDLLPDDGGVIVIHDCGQIFKLQALPSGLAVFASNGIWHITGSVGTGFSATDYTVQKITSTNAISASSFVDFAGIPVWWNAEGIFALQTDKDGKLTAQPLTTTTIQDFYDDIPFSSKRQARGIYNPITYEIQWLYRSTESGTVEEIYEFDRVLVFNTVTGSFAPWTLEYPTNGPHVHSMLIPYSIGGAVSSSNVIDDAANNVIDDSSNQVIVYSLQDATVVPRFKYFCSYPSGSSWKFTFATCEDDTRWLDWYSFDSTGTDYDSYFISGYKVRGEGQRKFQSNYLTLFSDVTPSRFTSQVRWNYASSDDSNKWGSEQSHTLSDTNYSVVKNRIKVPGMGVALQYKISSVQGYPFSVIGWSGWESGNAIP